MNSFKITNFFLFSSQGIGHKDCGEADTDNHALADFIYRLQVAWLNQRFVT